MVSAKNFRVVIITCDSKDLTLTIAKTLVSEQIAACCTIVPNIISVFGWQGTIHERGEFMIIVKTAEKCLDILEKRVLELHTDEVPEIISFALDSGFEAYLSWVENMVGAKQM